MFGSQLIAFPPLLLTFDNQSPAIGRHCLPSTGEVGVDGYAISGYHLINLDTQLSKNRRSCSLPLIPWLLPVSSERIAPNQCTRIAKQRLIEIVWACGGPLALQVVSLARNRYTELTNLVIENCQVRWVQVGSG